MGRFSTSGTIFSATKTGPGSSRMRPTLLAKSSRLSIEYADGYPAPLAMRSYWMLRALGTGWPPVVA